ncbi:sterol carrier family protein [Curtobacterium sp. RRHDQ10]|uniref:sterol carrier family protein n=1 Tax=Curtobacterium phyllosphaerae TaxID=3413379 RepID=UPI003BF37378
MPARIIDPDEGTAALDAVRRGAIDRPTTATAVRFLLQSLAAAVPGNSVEVRVPPFGAVQAVPGPRHTRGTPPNVVEMDAGTWLALATGELTWTEAVRQARVSASGSRADLTEFLPVRPTEA